MEEPNALSELGEWKDCIGYPLYSISSTGVFMNKRTLKILKHFRHKDSDEPAVTLYISGKSGHVLSVDGLLKTNFGPDATLPEVVYTNDKTTELGPPRPEKRNNLIKKASNEGGPGRGLSQAPPGPGWAGKRRKNQQCPILLPSPRGIWTYVT